MVPRTCVGLLPFSSSVKLPIKQPAFLRRSRRRNSQERRGRLIFPSHTAVTWATSSIIARIATTIKATNAIMMTDDMTIVNEMIDTAITLIAKTRTTRTKSPMRIRMIASAITSRKIATRPCIMTSPLCQVQIPHQKKGVTPIQDLVLALVLVLALAGAAATGAMLTIMWLAMTASWADTPSASTRTPLTMMTMDISITLARAILISPPSPLQKQRTRVSVPPNRMLHQQSKICVSHFVSSSQIGVDCLTDGHVKLNILDDTQELLNNGPKGCPNNLQSAWRLAELFFQ